MKPQRGCGIAAGLSSELSFGRRASHAPEPRLTGNLPLAARPLPPLPPCPGLAQQTLPMPDARISWALALILASTLLVLQVADVLAWVPMKPITPSMATTWTGAVF